MLRNSSTSNFEITPEEKVSPSTIPVAAIAFILLVCLIETIVWQHREWFADLASWQWKAKRELLQSGMLEGSVVVFGSSVLFHSLDPAFVNRALPHSTTLANLALNGMTLQHQTQLLEEYLAGNKKVDRIILELRHVTVQHKDWLRGPYFNFWASWTSFLESRAYYWRPSLLFTFAMHRLCPAYSYQNALDNWVFSCLRSQSLVQETRQRNAAVIEEMRAHLGFVRATNETSPLQVDLQPSPTQRSWAVDFAGEVWLHRFLRVCEQYRVHVMLFVPPVPPFLIEDGPEASFRSTLQTYITTLKQTYPRLALEVLAPQHYALDDFVDTHHLSQKGRARLTAEVAAWLKSRYPAIVAPEEQ